MRMQYDGATWEIALALLGLLELPEVYERGVLYLASTAGGSDLTGTPSSCPLCYRVDVHGSV